MRNSFIQTLLKEAEENPSIWLLNADLGYSVLEPFAEAFPERYLNVGVAEQNMAGIAAGLGMNECKVFCYSIGNFPTLRCFEQIRNDICYHQADVTMVSVGGGFSYGSQGYTHHAIEDLGAMRLLPGITVYSPCDPIETAAIVRTICSKENSGPAYLRLGRAGEQIFHTKNLHSDEDLLQPHFLTEGEDCLLIATGSIVGEALEATRLLQARGVELAVASVPVLKPLDEGALSKILCQFSNVVVLEEHSETGGLFDVISAHVVKTGMQGCKIASLAISDGETRGIIGDQKYMRSHCGIDSTAIVETVLGLL